MSAWLEALLGKISNSGVAIPLSKGLNFASGITAALNPSTKQIDVSATPAAVADGTVQGRAVGAGLGVPGTLSGTQLGQIARFGTFQSVNLVGGATHDNVPINNGVTIVFATVTGVGDAIVTGFEYAGGSPAHVGAVIRIIKTSNNGRIVFKREGLTSTASNRMFTPRALDWVLTYTDDVAQIARDSDPTGRWRFNESYAQPDAVSATELAPGAGSGVAVTFRVRITFTASGVTGTLIDVPIWVADSPFTTRFSARLRVSVAGGTAAALRTAAAGGGSVLLPDAATPAQTFSTASVGVKPDNAGATALVAAGGTVYLRVDRAVTGELELECCK
jgi:hypothetical protein